MKTTENLINNKMAEANDERAVQGKEVKLDRPFLYFIIDNETGMPLFMGKTVNLT